MGSAISLTHGLEPFRAASRGLRLTLLAVLACWTVGPSIVRSAPASPQAEALVEVLFRDGLEPPAAPPANDTCATAASLLIGIPTHGTTIAAINDYDSGLETCTGFSQAGGDVVYSVLLLASSSYTVTLSNPDTALDASISLVGPGTSGVCSAPPVTCLKGADSGFFGSGESFQYTPNASGTYYIIVDSSFSGKYDGGGFTIEVSPP
jgi:hypothetical protein